MLVTNWHVFEPKAAQAAGQSAKVIRAGREVRTRETIRIGPKTTTAHGTRYPTLQDFERQAAIGLITVLDEHRDGQGRLKSVSVESVRYVESDTRLIDRVLGREVGGKGNLLVMNDEAHHAPGSSKTKLPEATSRSGAGPVSLVSRIMTTLVLAERTHDTVSRRAISRAESSRPPAPYPRRGGSDTMAIRIKSEWHHSERNEARRKTFADSAGALTFIVWRLSVEHAREIHITGRLHISNARGTASAEPS